MGFDLSFDSSIVITWSLNYWTFYLDILLHNQKYWLVHSNTILGLSIHSGLNSYSFNLMKTQSLKTNTHSHPTWTPQAHSINTNWKCYFTHKFNYLDVLLQIQFGFTIIYCKHHSNRSTWPDVNYYTLLSHLGNTLMDTQNRQLQL